MPSLTQSHRDIRFYPSQTNTCFGKKLTEVGVEEMV
jgi:hypothetical protein